MTEAVEQPGEPPSPGSNADPESTGAVPEGPDAVRGWLARTLHVVWATALIIAVVLPNLPKSVFGEAPGTVASWLRPVSFVQSWRMYAPAPQRSQTYMNITAHYRGGREELLEETLQEQAGWGVTWAPAKTRVDIWRHYANFRPKQASEYRKWYLRAVCIREARKGEVPTKLVMEHVRRRFTPPHKVAAGRPDLGRVKRRVIDWMPCKGQRLRKMIEADRQRRGQNPDDGGTL